MVAYREKMHGRKSGPGIVMVRDEFGELMRGELMRFYYTCIYCLLNSIKLIYM